MHCFWKTKNAERLGRSRGVPVHRPPLPALPLAVCCRSHPPRHDQHSAPQLSIRNCRDRISCTSMSSFDTNANHAAMSDHRRSFPWPIVPTVVAALQPPLDLSIDKAQCAMSRRVRAACWRERSLRRSRVRARCCGALRNARFEVSKPAVRNSHPVHDARAPTNEALTSRSGAWILLRQRWNRCHVTVVSVRHVRTMKTCLSDRVSSHLFSRGDARANTATLVG